MDYDISSNKLKPRRALVKTIKVGEDLMLSTEAQEFELQPFDQVFVRENPDFEEPINIVLMGEVKYPGNYAVLQKDEQVSSVISRAGGLTEFAYVDGVKMYRKFKTQIINDDKLKIPHNLLDSILTNNELSNIYNLELLDRERHKTKTLSFDSVMYDIVYFDMQKAIAKPSSKHNLALREGDSVIIPRILDIVQITGDLNNIEGNKLVWLSNIFCYRPTSLFKNLYKRSIVQDNLMNKFKNINELQVSYGPTINGWNGGWLMSPKEYIPCADYGKELIKWKN
jgi:hypothetical protein